MQKTVLVNAISLFTILQINCMDTQPPAPITLYSLPHDILYFIIAPLPGAAKNVLAQTCKIFYALTAFVNREKLLAHPNVYLGPIEKHRLLVEYTRSNTPSMVKYMFDIGGSNNILETFGAWKQEPLTHGSINPKPCYTPSHTYFCLKNPVSLSSLEPCTKFERNLLHIATINGFTAIAEIIIKQAEKEAEPVPILETFIVKERNSPDNQQTKSSSDSNDITTSELPQHLTNTVHTFLNRQDAHGNTALHLAAEYNRGKIAKLILTSDLEVDTTIKNNRHFTPYEIAKSNGHSKITTLLATPHIKKNVAKD